ncbi:PAS domain-containing protein [Ferruginivarius sediminum]|uniref:PAS domain-containing protein n=1 Tax=Ferruginivarius sediminum TaxID=2661937 RepID=A0A369TE25_9PROT|nr:PAS domain-containing protein [Ferruginivarius sediminum]RDD62794.1 PAS domain-containing protein [Ferruginivarius sediminum]
MLYHEQLASLLDRWRFRRGTRRLPTHGDFRFTDLQPWIGHIGLVEIQGGQTAEPHMKVRLAGRRLVEYDGADFSGKYLDDVVPEYARGEILRPYLTCVRKQAPQYSVFTPDNPELEGYRMHRLLLPTTSNGKDIDLVLVGIYVDRWEEAEGNSSGTIYDLMSLTGS